MITIYGIKNCDTIKKTLKWFDNHSVDYTFVDYKKEPPTVELAESFMNQHGWETIINKRGTTWRKLDDHVKNTMDTENAIALIQKQPSVIKRPIIVKDKKIWVGFNETEFEQFI